MNIILDPRPSLFLTTPSVMRKREELWGRDYMNMFARTKIKQQK